MKGGTVQVNWHDMQPVLSLDFHPNSGLLATGGSDRDIKLWVISPTESQKKIPGVTYKASLSYHGSAINILRFSPSGEFLASGADGGELVIWKLQSADEPHVWKVFKTLLFHRKDVLDLEWSADGAFIVSGSVDNSCIIWDVVKGTVHQMLDAHLHYVQGVAWDPLGHYIASISSDRTCRIYAKKSQNKVKGQEKISYVCHQVLSKSEPMKHDDSKPLLAKSHLFHDETLPSFFRRLAWSPEGSFLLVPAGIYKYSPSSETVNTAYIYSRKDLSRPAIQLPGANKPIVAVRFCPVLFCLRGSNSDSFFKLPYRIVFAIATLNSLYIYDTECTAPIAIFAGLHYAAITDVSWSSDAKYLALSSRDGYCTVVEFESDELGMPFSTAKATEKATEENASLATTKPESEDRMEVDDPNQVKVDTTDETKAVEGSQVQPASTKKSDPSRASRKRITPVAIN